jgi:hypothetical protein
VPLPVCLSLRYTSRVPRENTVPLPVPLPLPPLLLLLLLLLLVSINLKVLKGYHVSQKLQSCRVSASPAPPACRYLAICLFVLFVT